MGIVDYITKPFSPEAITAVVQHTVAKYQGADAPRTDAITAADLADGGAGRGRALAALRGVLTDVVAARVAALFALADAAGDTGGERDARVPTDAAAIADTVRSALDDDALAGVVARLDPALFDGESLRGDLRVIPLAEVVQLLDHQEQSGVLTVARGETRIDIYFRRGRIEQALGQGTADDLLLGRYIVDSELMPRGDFDAFLASRATGRLIGEQLVRLGHLSAADRRAALVRQTSELLYEALRWRYGSFRFVAGGEAPAPVIEAALELDVEALLMEGFRRVDEWHLIEQAIDDFELVFLRNEDAVAQMGRGRLTREELAVLELVNGKNTVKDIVRKSRMGSFEVSKMLYRLRSIKLVRRRVLPVAV